MQYHIGLLTRQHKTKNFKCEDEALGEYIQRFALQNSKKGFSRTYVLTAPGDPEVLGYYSLSTGAVMLSAMPTGSGMPKVIPTIHLGRLATSRPHERKGIGEQLLFDAFRNAQIVADIVGVFAMDVYSLENSVNFYLKYEFEPLDDSELHLYIPMHKIKCLDLN